MATPLENLPEVRSYAATAEGGNVNLTGSGSIYEPLPVGVSTIMVGSQQSSLTAHLTSGTGGAHRYRSVEVAAGRPVTLTNVAVPKGERRYLNVQAARACDVGVTIITYPL